MPKLNKINRRGLIWTYNQLICLLNKITQIKKIMLIQILIGCKTLYKKIILINVTINNRYKRKMYTNA
jgi:hypothetical protein